MFSFTLLGSLKIISAWKQPVMFLYSFPFKEAKCFCLVIKMDQQPSSVTHYSLSKWQKYSCHKLLILQGNQINDPLTTSIIFLSQLFPNYRVILHYFISISKLFLNHITHNKRLYNLFSDNGKVPLKKTNISYVKF